MLSVEPIKAFEDNYIWLVTTNEGSIVIDPGESKEIIKQMDNNLIDLKGILITHHHFDHTNGLSDLSMICFGIAFSFYHLFVSGSCK